MMIFGLELDVHFAVSAEVVKKAAGKFVKENGLYAVLRNTSNYRIERN